MAKIKFSKFKKAVAVGVIAGSVGLSFWASKVFYTVTYVIDGDTFVTTENQRVRLDSVNTPEMGNCLADEAKKELEKLVLNKKVFIKVTFIDDYNRLVGTVFTNSGNVSEKLLAKGLATYTNKGNLNQDSLLLVAQNARKNKIGIYSEKCTQLENFDNPKCNIKGNIRPPNNFYHVVGCEQYKNTQVQLYLGDKWFCSEKEAIKAGFIKSPNCP